MRARSRRVQDRSMPYLATIGPRSRLVKRPSVLNSHGNSRRDLLLVRSSDTGATLRQAARPPPLIGPVRFFAYVLLAAAAAVGCGNPASPPSITGGSGGSAATGGTGAAGNAGAGGAAAIGGAGGTTPACPTSTLCPSCPDAALLCDGDDACETGEVCLATGCGDLRRCFALPGGACLGDDDCGTDLAYACNLEINRCLRVDGGCADSNDCVAGFACEDGVCTDRRLACTVVEDCPHGYTCRASGADQRFCRRVTRPCNANLDCQVFGVPCGDVDGDGQMECMAPFDPETGPTVSCDNSQCTSPTFPVCELTDDATRAVCGRFGLCDSEGDCAAGFDCADLWGDGRAECVLRGGSCTDSRDCDERQLCASPRSGDPPTCVGVATM